MPRFVHAHAMHPDWRMALALAAAQLDAQRGDMAPTLGVVYFTDHYAPHAEPLLADLRQRWPGTAWVGASGVGIAAGGVEYFDEGALALLVTDLPAERFRVFSGTRPLRGFPAHTALVHADPATADLGELIDDLAERTGSGYLFGGLASSRSACLHVADDVLRGGLSGVAFDAEVGWVSRVTQGCQPVGPARLVGAAERNVVTVLDGEPALDVLLRDVGLAGSEPRAALPRLRNVLVGLSESVDTKSRSRADFGDDVRVRHLIGLDPGQRGIAIGDMARPGQRLAFCTRNTEAARRDLVRICAEIREETDSEEAGGASGIAGAIYVSCSGRGGPHFGAPSAELAIVRHALGDVPLVGFFAAGEIAHRQVHGYTGVLTVFRA